jgi:hypothetical protein
VAGYRSRRGESALRASICQGSPWKLHGPLSASRHLTGTTSQKNPRRSGGSRRLRLIRSYFLRRRPRLSKESPSENAFCRTAPSVRRIIRPILRAGVVFASDLSCRTSPANQGTLFRAAIVKPPYRLFAMTTYACSLFIAIDDPNNDVVTVPQWFPRPS